jgi:hypothetical protein
MLRSEHPWLKSYFHGKRAQHLAPVAEAGR